GSLCASDFDRWSGRASRINPTQTGEGGLILRFYLEPQFSYVDPNLVYGAYNGSGTNLHTVNAFDFSTGSYSTLLDLETVASASALQNTYINVIGSSSGPLQKIMALFGGLRQDAPP